MSIRWYYTDEKFSSSVGLGCFTVNLTEKCEGPICLSGEDYMNGVSMRGKARTFKDWDEANDTKEKL